MERVWKGGKGVEGVEGVECGKGWSVERGAVWKGVQCGKVWSVERKGVERKGVERVECEGCFVFFVWYGIRRRNIVNSIC